jgi:hypothetical protein
LWQEKQTPHQQQRTTATRDVLSPQEERKVSRLAGNERSPHMLKT